MTDGVRRMRTDTKVEDKARSKRLFGNLLGTLQQFKKDDKNARTSAAVSCSKLCTTSLIFQAKKREEISERIASKIRTETSLHHDIVEAERELKSLRVSTDHAEVVLRHKEAAVCESCSCVHSGLTLRCLLVMRHSVRSANSFIPPLLLRPLCNSK